MLVTFSVSVIEGIEPVLPAVPINVVEFNENTIDVVDVVFVASSVTDEDVLGPYEDMVQFVVGAMLYPPVLGAPVMENVDVVVQVVSVMLLGMVLVNVTAVPVGYIEGPEVKVEFNVIGV